MPEYTARELQQIFASAATSGVKKFKYDNLEISFEEPSPAIPEVKSAVQSKEEEKKLTQAEEERLLAAAVEIRQAQLEQMKAQDTETYEDLLLTGDLTDDREEIAAYRTDYPGFKPAL